MRIIEFFCGIGGVAAAVEGRAEVAAAVDISRPALDVYTHNWPHPTLARELETVPADLLRQWNADIWWLSPPCQPYTCRGRQRDVDDPRARSLLTLIARIDELRPRYVALENVPGFATSRAHRRLRDVLDRHGYWVHEQLLCPSQLGVPMQRQRFYLTAAVDNPNASYTWAIEARAPSLKAYLDDAADADPRLAVHRQVLDRYKRAVHVIDRADASAVAHCFTAAYGRSHVRSGSYLKTAAGVRRFSPGEIARLMGFGASFQFPPQLPLGKAWQLVGNSLSVDAVRRVFKSFGLDT